jgi:hypothetical protein
MSCCISELRMSYTGIEFESRIHSFADIEPLGLVPTCERSVQPDRQKTSHIRFPRLTLMDVGN